MPTTTRTGPVQRSATRRPPGRPGPITSRRDWTRRRGPDTTEFGLPRTTNPGNRRYTWHGAAQRATDNPAGITLMGVRLYNPTTGRFLTTDPIHGGNDNPYTYPPDPINNTDLDGRESRWHKIRRHAVEVAACASLGAYKCGIAGAISALSLSVVRYLAGGMQNAVRHFVWQSMLSVALSVSAAKRLGDAHEWSLANDEDRRVREDTAKDLFNNRYARRYTRSASGYSLHLAYRYAGMMGLLGMSLSAGIREYERGRLR